MAQATEDTKSGQTVQLQLTLSADGVEPVKSQDPSAKSKQWLNPVSAPIIVAILSSIAPIAQAIQGHYENTLSLAIEQQRLDDARTQSLLQFVLDTIDSNKETRLFVLGYLAVQRDTYLAKWAFREVVRLEPEVDRLREAVKGNEDEFNKTDKMIAEKAKEISDAAPEDLKKLHDKLDSLQAQRDTEQAELLRLSTELRGPSAQPSQPEKCLYGFFNPIKKEDFEIPDKLEHERSKLCDQSLIDRQPRPEALKTPGGTQWRWVLDDGTTCGCKIIK